MNIRLIGELVQRQKMSFLKHQILVRNR
ncbi:hypothetical protein ACP8HZ_05395 [Francisella noatunensis]